MAALIYDPRRYYTVDEFAALPEDTSARYELQDGVIVMTPKPGREIMMASYSLAAQVDPQLPDELFAVGSIEIDLALPTQVVRVPDVVVARREVLRMPGMTKASDVVLVVEVLSARTNRLDTKIKIVDYAEARIPHYWVVDPECPGKAMIYRLVDGAYEESQRAEGTFSVHEPCELTVDLDALLR